MMKVLEDIKEDLMDLCEDNEVMRDEIASYFSKLKIEDFVTLRRVRRLFSICEECKKIFYKKDLNEAGVDSMSGTGDFEYLCDKCLKEQY